MALPDQLESSAVRSPLGFPCTKNSFIAAASNILFSETFLVKTTTQLIQTGGPRAVCDGCIRASVEIDPQIVFLFTIRSLFANTK
mgnify:CR=1 FL=1